MSVRVSSRVWESEVPAPQRFTLLALADHADHDGRCWPSLPTLTRRCRLSETTVRAHLIALESDGVIKVERRPGLRTHYQINLARLGTEPDPHGIRGGQEPPEVVSTPTESEGVGTAEPAGHPLGSDGGTPSESGPLTPSDSEPPTPSDLVGDPLRSRGGTPSDSELDPLGFRGRTVIEPSVPTTSRTSVASRAQARDAADEPRTKTPRGSRIPDDFVVTPEMVVWARENVPHVDGRIETAKFIDYWRSSSGARARKTDWVATWRNWMRTADERRGSNRPGRPARRTLDERVADVSGYVAKVLGTGTEGGLTSPNDINRPDLRALPGGMT